MKAFVKKWILFSVLSICLVLTACSAGTSSSQDSNGKIKIVTTIAQIGEPLSVIGGEYVDVESLMGPSVDQKG